MVESNNIVIILEKIPNNPNPNQVEATQWSWKECMCGRKGQDCLHVARVSLEGC